MTFDEELFSIESHPTCIWDYVSVQFDSFDEKYCGKTVPAPITSSGNTMTVKFHSDQIVQDKGFSANWQAVEANNTVPAGGAGK